MKEQNRKEKILLVEDTPSTIEKVKTSLEDEGYEVFLETSGAKAIRRAEFILPHLILLDTLLPDMDGFETCRRLKMSQRTREIPVIFMTPLVTTENKVRGFEVGGVDCVSKPIEMEEVLARVRTHLALRSMHQQLKEQNEQLEREIAERKWAEASLRESEAHLRALIDNLPFEFWAMDDSLRYTMQNAASLRNHGKMVGKRAEDLDISPETKLKWAKQNKEVLEGEILHGEDEVYREGEKRVYENFLAPAVVGKAIVGIVGVAMDVTDRRRAEEELRKARDELEQRVAERTLELREANLQLRQEIEERKRIEKALRENERRYRGLFEESPISLWEEDFSRVGEYLKKLRAAGVRDVRSHFEEHPEALIRCASDVAILDVNKATLDLLEVKDKQELMADLGKIFIEESFKVFREELIALAEGRLHFESEIVQKTFSGKEKEVMFRLTVAPGYEDSLGRVLVSLVDISERKLAEDKIRQSEEKFRNLFESAPEGIIITTLTGEIVSFNNALMNIFKFGSPDELRRLNIRSLYANPDERPGLLERLKKEELIEDYQLNLKDASDRIFPASLSIRLVQYEGKTRIQTILRDVTRIKRMEAELKDYAENLERMVEEKTGELLRANEELSAAIKSLNETREQLALSAHRAGMAEIAASVLHNIGNAINSINVRTYNLAERMLTREIQSLERIYDLLRSGKMLQTTEADKGDRESLLAFLSTIIEIIKKKNEDFRTDMEFLRKGLDHVMEIIALQQRYAGLRGLETRVDFNELIRDAAEMLQDSITQRQIRMEFQLNDLPLLLLDKNKLIQILINIFKNAYESIDMAPPENEKKILVSTSLVKEATDEFAEAVIADTGVGISPEEKDKVFQFSYSTKKRKTGFGLHDAANYITAQGGSVRLLSEGRNRGAHVVIRLPVRRMNGHG